MIFSSGPIGVHFNLVAVEEEGMKLERKLQDLQQKQPVKFIAQGGLRDDVIKGLCKIVNLRTEKDETKVPVIYHIDGSLELVQ